VAKSKFKGKDVKTYSCENWLNFEALEEVKFGSDVTNRGLIKAL